MRADHRVDAVSGIEAADEDDVPVVAQQLLDRLRVGREMVGVDPVGDHVVGIREVGRQRSDAGLADADPAVQPLDRRADQLGLDVHAQRLREDAVKRGHRQGVLGGVLDRPGRHLGVVGGMHVDDVEAALAEERAQPPAQPRADRVQCLRAVAPPRHVEADAGAHADDLERGVGHVHGVVDHSRRLQQPAGDDRDLMAERGQLARLAVDVLGDAAQGGVVEIGDDSDPHGRGILPNGPRLALSPLKCQRGRCRRYTGIDADLRVPMRQWAHVRGTAEVRGRSTR